MKLLVTMMWIRFVYTTVYVTIYSRVNQVKFAKLKDFEVIWSV